MPMKLRQYRMFFERSDESVSPDALGLRSKLGGDPTWEQYDETPDCPSCGDKMSFIAQIDSIEHQSEDNPHSMSAIGPDQQYLFGDVGLIYLFACLNCNTTGSVMQFG